MVKCKNKKYNFVKNKSMKTETQEISQETQGKHYEADVRNIKPLNRAGGNIRTDYGKSDGSFEELTMNY